MSLQECNIPKSWATVESNEATETISDNGLRIKQKDYLPVGSTPVIDQGEGLIGGYTDRADARIEAPLPIIVFGDHTRRFKYVTFPFAVGADGVKLLHPSAIWNPNFLFYQLNNVDLEDRGYGRHFQYLRKLILLLPPLNEQSRIVEKLEELFSDLDAGVTELKAAQKKLGQYRQSLLKAAVEGALTAEWRNKNKSNETGAQLLERVLKERRIRWEEKQLARLKEQGKTPPKGWQDKYLEPVQPDTTNLPELPEGWVWASVDCLISEIETGKSFKCDEHPPTIDEVGVVKVSAVTWGEYKEQESKTCTDPDRVNDTLFVRPGDFLFSRANTIELVGACVIAEKVTLNVMLSDKILRFILVDGNTKKWLLFLLRSELGRAQIEELASGNQESMRNIGQERIRQISIPLPPSIEIQQILSILDSNFEAAIAQSNAIKVGLKQSAAQRKNILKTAFSGQLVPQNPNDESASVLLERIREERKKQSLQPKQRKAKVTKEISIVTRKLIDVLSEAGDWLPAQEAFRRCGIADSATTEQIEDLYSELRRLDKENRVIVEPVVDANGIKQYDRLRIAVKG